jgi:hypothetical protein
MTHWWLSGPLAIAILAGCRRESASEGVATGEGCPPEWTAPPAVDPAIAVPQGGGQVVVHGAATGSQNYACTRSAADGGGSATYAWTLTGPEASLADCRGKVIGRHFASDAGASAPEWQSLEGSYVVGHKLAASTPPGAAGSVPWLLLTTDGRGGSAPIARARFVQRVATHGGTAPSTPCTDARVGAIEKVPYTADYYFFAP